MCNFNLAWIGNCKNTPATDSENGMCDEHKDLTCECCGKPATRQCHETFGFVCGTNLCDTCEHYITDKGVNFGGCKHVEQGKQDHVPWYVIGSTKELVEQWNNDPKLSPKIKMITDIERTKGRSETYYCLSAEKQQEEDKQLGILN